MSSNLEMLNPINARYAECLSGGWSELFETEVVCELESETLVHRTAVEISCQDRHNYRFEMDPLLGRAVVSFSHALAHAFVYRASGGLSGSPPPKGRPFSDVERKQMAPAAVRSMATLEAAWNPYVPVAIHDTEHLRDGDPIPEDLQDQNLRVTLKVQIDESWEDACLYYPMSMLEPILDRNRIGRLWDEMKKRVLADPKNWDVNLQNDQQELEFDKLRKVLRVVHSVTNDYWLFGGFAVDLLTGRVVREHHDVDIFADYDALPLIAEEMASQGWSHDRDWTTGHATTFSTKDISVDVARVRVCSNGRAQRCGRPDETVEWPLHVLDRNAVPFGGEICQTLTAENLFALKQTDIDQKLGPIRAKDIIDMERLRQIIDGERRPLQIE